MAARSRRRFERLPLVPCLAAALAGAGCATDHGQGPSALPAGGTILPALSLTVVSGETQAAVAGARVVVGGAEYPADAEGRVALPTGLSAGTLVDVVAGGFLDRQTTLGQRGSGDRLTLWPRASANGLDERFTTEVVYTTAAIGEDPVPGGVALKRWAPGVSQVAVFYLGPHEDAAFVPFSEDALGVQRAAVDEINQAAGGRVVYAAPVPGPAPAGGAARVVLRIHPGFEPCVASPENWAVTSLAEGEITSATVTYCRADAPRELGLSVHELGHTFGLRHSSTATDVMRAFGRRTQRLSERERLVMALMLQRPAGNRFPDNDRLARASGAGEEAIACARSVSR